MEMLWIVDGEEAGMEQEYIRLGDRLAKHHYHTTYNNYNHNIEIKTAIHTIQQ